MSAPDFTLPLKFPPLPKGSGSRKPLPARCPHCRRAIPLSTGIGKRGPFVESADSKTQKRPAGSLKKQGHAIKRAAAVAFDEVLDGPCRVRVQFRFVKPPSAKKSRTRPTHEPDIDKLCRTVLDALEGEAFTNDARVVELVATKVYADAPGVAVQVRAL